VARLGGATRAIAAEIRGAEAMLRASLALATDAPIPPLDTGITTTAPPAPEAVRTMALAQRPELGAGQAEITRARSEVSAMQSMYAPMGLVRTGPAYTMAEGTGWMLMLGISVPIWRGRLRASVDEAEAMLAMAQAGLRAMRRMVEGEADAARERVEAARARVMALRDEVLPMARQAIDPTLAGYGAGQLPIVSVIEAASALWSSQSELVMAQMELGLAWARLQRATGGNLEGGGP
jgi:outer membrane protein TolC